MDEKWITLTEAARYTGLSVVTVRRAVRQERMRAVRVNRARVWRTTRAWVDEYMDPGACARRLSAGVDGRGVSAGVGVEVGDE
jgi:excisionase family DNA binding protein